MNPGSEQRTRLVIRFDGPTLRSSDTGEPIATLWDDGIWRTPDGVVTEGLWVPEPRLGAAVSREAVVARNRELDAAWLEAAMEVVERLALERAEFTSDEVWERLEHPPREGRQLGARAIKHLGPIAIVPFGVMRHRRRNA